MIQEANLHWRYIDTETNLLMPWYTLPALQWLKEQDVSRWYVFEYGAGYSTMWWNANARFNFAVENNKTWAFMAGSNCYFREDPNEYVNAAQFILEEVSTDDGSYDCVVIDGDFRAECVLMSRKFIHSGGYMIIDNYGQTDFPPKEVIDKLLEGWEKQVFKQPNHTDWATAIFKKP